MLELRPNCESCAKDLPPESLEAYICTYECTFCFECVKNLLMDVCPNCGGGFSPRPIRPKNDYRAGVSLTYQPASTFRVITKYSTDELSEFAKSIQHIKPENR